ncbi:AI-2E family transporter [Nocardioides sp.]|uniref:AI-2E family transporter n=1 Tax=Nocardioides sp. TaxID=35761 RepID=UPI00356A6F5E
MSDEEPGKPQHGRVASRLAHQWSAMRQTERHPPPPRVEHYLGEDIQRSTGALVPRGVEVAAAWSWRVLVIVGVAALLGWLISFFAVVVIPVVIALLIAALVVPLVEILTRIGVRRSLASFLVVLTTMASVGLLLTFAGQQIAQGATDLADQTVAGLQEIKDWLRDGPLNASDSQIDNFIKSVQDAITEQSSQGGVLSRVTEVGAALGHVAAGFFIVLFSTYFFLADGSKIWAWLVRLAPRAARHRVDTSGRVAWISLTQFTRATVIIAATDALAIGIIAGLIGVPFALAIGVLVFLGAFVPIIGATIAGSVAVLVALVAQGPLVAVFMLIAVIAVQQLEGHVLQPFLMGRWVSVHPLGVILAIAAGVLTAGVAGALVAVPLAAATNAVVLHLAGYSQPGDDPVHELAEDYEELAEDFVATKTEPEAPPTAPEEEGERG